MNIMELNGKNDVPDSRAITLINASRKWGFFPSDHGVNEMND